MITINMHNKTGLEYDTIWNAVVRAINKDKIVEQRNLRIHNGRREDGIISITACNPRGNADVVIEADITDVSQMVKVAKALEDAPESVNNDDNYVVDQKGEVVE